MVFFRRNSSFKKREMPSRLGGEQRPCGAMWMELNNVGLECCVCMEEGKEVEKKNGKEGMYFGFLRHVKTTVLQGF
jgi:hypothetical protein